MKVVFASSNAGKIHELQDMMNPLGIQLTPQSLLGVNDIEETGVTFVENALLKARHASHVTHLPAIADDSGLQVDVLSGAPGIYSARYAGPTANAKDNIDKLLRHLQDFSEAERTAAYHCVLVYVANAKDPTPLICEGVWRGKILFTPQGDGGFGYDPVFYVESEKCSAAQLPLSKKNELSHRGRALRALLAKLPEKIKC